MYEPSEYTDALCRKIIGTIGISRAIAEQILENMLYPESEQELFPAEHSEMLILILRGLSDRFHNLSVDLDHARDQAMQEAYMRHPSYLPF